MNMSALQYRRPIRKNLLALGTMVLLIPSIPALGQVPGSQAELPSAPSAKADSYSSQQSKTSLAGTDQTSSIESGRETLTEQADYFVPMTNGERWDHYVYSLVEPQAFLYPAVQAPAVLCDYRVQLGSKTWPSCISFGGLIDLRATESMGLRV